MLKVLPEAEDRIVGLKFVGRIDPADYQATMPALEKTIARAKPTGVLLDWKDLAGWAPAAESSEFWARIRHRESFERVAIVGASKWRNEAAEIGRILGCEVRFYELAEEYEAWDWLRGN